VRGRTFTPDEVSNERPVAVIGERVARTFFGDVDPIGRPVSSVASRSARELPGTIIGVVADAMPNRITTELYGVVYLPLERKRANTPGLVVRSASPGAASRAVEDALRRIDPRVRVTTAVVAQQVEGYVGQTRMLAWLAAPMAALALVLATLGLYGVTAFAVNHRAQEMSIRTAIGASTGDLLRLIVRDGLRPVIAGLAIGLFAALVISRLFSSALPGVSPHDPLAIAAALLTLLSSALGAVLIPARRVVHTDPAAVLRQV
jgi:hypothetical protein